MRNGGEIPLALSMNSPEKYTITDSQMGAGKACVKVSVLGLQTFANTDKDYGRKAEEYGKVGRLCPCQ